MASLKAPLIDPESTVFPELNGSPSPYLGYRRHGLPSTGQRRRSHARRIYAFVFFIVLLAFLLNPIVAVGLSVRQWLVEPGGGAHVDTPLVLLLSDRYHISECINGNEWTVFDAKTNNYGMYAAETSFEIPIPSTSLSLIANGHLSPSNLRVVAAGQPSEFVTVDVVANYRTRSALNRVVVCHFHGTEGENGIGFLGPFDRRAMVNIDVTVYLPPTVDGSVRIIPEFRTNLPMFGQYLDDLVSGFEFERISLGGKNSPVEVKSVNAISASVSTENAPIIGFFNTTSSLELTTKNAPIDVTINAYNNVTKEASVLKLANMNRPIAARLSLFSMDPSGTKGKFKVSAKTQNGIIRIENLVSPPDSALHLFAKSCNAPVDMSVHPAFEGKFVALGAPNSVTYNKYAKDPKEEGRQRMFSVKKFEGNLAKGRVWWSSSDSGEELPGSVVLITRNGQATLIL